MINKPIRRKSSAIPRAFINLGNETWYYNYDPQEIETVSSGDEEREVPQRYSYIQIKFRGKPEYKKCVELIIREYVTQSQEFDLINSANKALLAKEEIPQEYMEYLDLLEEIKTKVKADFENLNS